MKGHFVTIFPHLQAQHLGKDPAQIPYRMHSSQGYRAELLTLDHGEDLTQASDKVRELPIVQIPRKGKWGSLEKALLQYIRKQAKRIDVLHLVGFTRINLFYGLLYKYHNPGGQLYIKGDIYNHRLRERTVTRTRKKWKKPFIRWLERKALKALDLISFENQKAPPIFRDLYPAHADKAIHLPNGIDERFLEQEFPQVTPWEEKEDRFIVAGRIGHPYKNHDILLKALEKVDLKGWEVRFIGPIDERFIPIQEAFFKEHPEKKEQVKFLGPIYEAGALFDEHRLAKVQLLPSRIESFGHVLLEGGAFDQYIIGSKGILPFDEVTNGETFGEALEEVNEEILSARIQQVTEDPDAFRIPAGAFRAHIMEHFTWGKVVEELDEALEQRKAQR